MITPTATSPSGATSSAAASPSPSRLRRTCGQLYVQVLGAVVLGAVVGALWPTFGAELKPLGDAFIALIRMMIAPLIFCTVVTGIASVESMRSVGRIAGKALLYFEMLTTLAMLIGLAVVKIVQPGAGMHIDPSHLSTAGLPPAATQPSEGFVNFLLGIIPDSFVSALTGGEILPVLLVSVLFGFGLQAAGDTGVGVLRGVESVSKVMFSIIRWIMRVAPIGAFGSMAYTVGAFGLGSLSHLGLLVGSFWGAALLFVFGGLGLVMRLNGLRLLPLLRYIREELLIVVGTSSSEPVLPRLMDKLQLLGASKPVVGLTIPAGYSFNLDGTALYLTMGGRIPRAGPRCRPVLGTVAGPAAGDGGVLQGRCGRHGVGVRGSCGHRLGGPSRPRCRPRADLRHRVPAVIGDSGTVEARDQGDLITHPPVLDAVTSAGYDSGDFMTEGDRLVHQRRVAVDVAHVGVTQTCRFDVDDDLARPRWSRGDLSLVEHAGPQLPRLHDLSPPNIVCRAFRVMAPRPEAGRPPGRRTTSMARQRRLRLRSAPAHKPAPYAMASRRRPHHSANAPTGGLSGRRSGRSTAAATTTSTTKAETIIRRAGRLKLAPATAAGHQWRTISDDCWAVAQPSPCSASRAARRLRPFITGRLPRIWAAAITPAVTATARPHRRRSRTQAPAVAISGESRATATASP